MVCQIPVYEGNVQTGTKTITIEPVLSNSFYYYTLTGVTAVQMGDEITAQLHMEKEGQPYLSKVDTYSIARYAYAQLDKPTTADSLKALCADLLRYGSKAQIFKSYRTDSLVDAAMTEAHRAYLSDIEAVTFGNTKRVERFHVRSIFNASDEPVLGVDNRIKLEKRIMITRLADALRDADAVQFVTEMESPEEIHMTAKLMVVMPMESET